MILGVQLLLLACGGCGTGEYEKRLNERIGKLQEETPFKTKLCPPGELYNTPQVTVRVPTVFKQSWLEGSREDPARVDSKPVDPRRVKPSTLDFPELKITYEAFAPYQEGQVAYYCCFGAREVPKGRAAPDPSDFIWNQLQNPGKFPEIELDRKDVQCATPEGRGIGWKKIHATCPQEFYFLDADGKGKFRLLPGVIDVYAREDAGYIITVIWRAPAEIEQDAGLAELAALVGGCVTAQGNP